MAMSINLILIMLLLLVGFLVLIILSIKKQQSGIKIMLLGITIMLTGGIIAADPDSSLGGLEYITVLVGLITSILGFSRNDKTA